MLIPRAGHCPDLVKHVIYHMWSCLHTSTWVYASLPSTYNSLVPAKWHRVYPLHLTAAEGMTPVEVSLNKPLVAILELPTPFFWSLSAFCFKEADFQSWSFPLDLCVLTICKLDAIIDRKLFVNSLWIKYNNEMRYFFGRGSNNCASGKEKIW